MCPISGTYKLILSTEYDKFRGIIRTFTNADNNISDDFAGCVRDYKAAIIEQGTWILYEDEDYNDDKKGEGKFVVYEGPGTFPLDFQPRSLRPISSNTYSVTLYRHKHFGGKQNVFTAAAASLADFPIFNEAGVSSIIVNSGYSWKFFTGYNYTGETFVLKPGRYASADTFHGIDDRIQSLKPV